MLFANGALDFTVKCLFHIAAIVQPRERIPHGERAELCLVLNQLVSLFFNLPHLPLAGEAVEHPNKGSKDNKRHKARPIDRLQCRRNDDERGYCR
ncbi:hypothetical protein SDC9_138914 [bioreactor metagenome]|uniref:Uncharacterized protein n=1 Tax=bioreactor metagenome TaxID=1076179 RepID=A0A645DQM6_9ZZZZ